VPVAVSVCSVPSPALWATSNAAPAGDDTIASPANTTTSTESRFITFLNIG
jgi:hypothetical protein